jgi:hypothetical protein
MNLSTESIPTSSTAPVRTVCAGGAVRQAVRAEIGDRATQRDRPVGALPALLAMTAQALGKPEDGVSAPDGIVIGGGMAGVSIAYELAVAA